MRARSVIRVVAALLAGAALVWGLVRFGATEPWSLYGLFLLLVFAALIALPAIRREDLGGSSWLALALVGVWLLGQTAFRSTLAAQGFVHLAVGWLALALSLWLSSTGRRAASGIFLLLVLVGTAEAGFALLELRGTISAIARNPGIQRHLAVGTLINPNHFSGLVNMTLALACGALAALPGRAPGNGRGVKRFAGAVLLLAGISLMALASLRTESRGGTLALLSALVWMALLVVFRRRLSLRRNGSSRVSLWAGALVGLLLLAGVGTAVTRSGILSLQHRAEVSRETSMLIRDHPLLGVGPGMYMWRFRPYQTFNIEGRYFHAHNDYLQTAAEWGIPAALLFWAFIAWRLHRSARRYVRSEDRWRAGIALGCSGAIVVILVHSLVDFNLQIPGNLMIFATIVGLAWSLEPRPNRDAGRPPSSRARWMGRTLIWVILPVLLLAAGAAAARQLAAIQQARKVPGIAGFEGAVALDPDNPELRFRLALLYLDDLEVQDLGKARRHMEAAVRLNPYAWRYRLEAARLYEVLGREESAANAYGAALELNPLSPEYHWRAANFLLRRGDLEDSLPSFALALGEPRYASGAALPMLLAAGASFSQLDRIWPGDRMARLGLLNRLVRQDDLSQTRVSRQDLLELWNRLLREPEPPTPSEAGPFLQFLLDQRLFAAARLAWVDLAAARGSVDEPFAARQNYLWNGGFELPLSEGLLGWQQYAPLRSAFGSATIENRQGSRALAIDLRGSSDIKSWWHIKQLAIVDPGASYQLSLAAGTSAAWEELVETTLKVRDRRNRRSLLEAKVAASPADEARLTWAWEAPEETHLVEVMIEARTRNTGTSATEASAWLNSLAVRRVGPEEAP